MSFCLFVFGEVVTEIYCPQDTETRSSAVAEGPRDVHVIVVMPSLNMCEMATNCVVVYAKSRFCGLQFCR